MLTWLEHTISARQPTAFHAVNGKKVRFVTLLEELCHDCVRLTAEEKCGAAAMGYLFSSCDLTDPQAV